MKDLFTRRRNLFQGRWGLSGGNGPEAQNWRMEKLQGIKGLWSNSF